MVSAHIYTETLIACASTALPVTNHTVPGPSLARAVNPSDIIKERGVAAARPISAASRGTGAEGASQGTGTPSPGKKLMGKFRSVGKKVQALNAATKNIMRLFADVKKSGGHVP